MNSRGMCLWGSGLPLSVGRWIGLGLVGALASSSLGADELSDRLGRVVGRTHPMVVHFPIALIIAACVLELAQAVRRRTRPSPAGQVCLWLGAPMAGAAALAGWLNASFENPGSGPVELHRWIGVSVAAIAAILAIAGGVIGSRRAGLSAYRLVLVIAAGLVGLEGHLGGTITYGDDYLLGPLRVLLGAESEEGGSGGGAPQGKIDLTHVRFPADGKIDFARDVEPILATACYECHGERKRKGKLRLDAKVAAMKGGKSGPLFVAGKPEESQIIQRVKGIGDEQRMPLDRDPLPAECIRILEAWVSQGAVWPDDGVSAAQGEEEKHWAYVPPTRREPPKVKSAKWVRNPVDAFVLAKLEGKKLKPSPEADKETLIRRVTLDLTGLPPTPDETTAFLADARSDAYERLVDRLLASPHYGERWARPWLDLARYADTNGYEKDLGRSVWPYRDWVIDAFNADMPYDRFSVEQLAGDLLPGATQEQLIATGFQRNSMINEEGGVDPEEYRVNAVIDRANTAATIWLGSTMGCAQCHDHKFDPFTQKDYYRFFAFFNNQSAESELMPGSEFRDISPKITLADPAADSQRALIGELESVAAFLGADHPESSGVRKEIDEIRKATPPAVTTLVMKEMETPRVSHVLVRGSFMSPGDEVEPGVPAVFGQGIATAGLPGVFPPSPRLDRLALAKWLVSEENPMAARVMVNHLWEQHFGRGIVETSEDFGTRGSAPTHPELLDWLATEFLRRNWSMKAMHRLIVTSATYRQSSRVTPELRETDPANKWLARGPRFRMDAEMIRDQALAVSGLLSLKMGGPPVFPEQPPGIWASPYSGDRWLTSSGEDLHRRGIYTYWKRGSPYPQFVSFDAPNRTVACTRRPRTDTPLQALTTLNDPVFMEAAAGLARRVVARRPEERMEFAVRVCLARGPTDEERERLEALLRQQMEHYRADPGAARELVEGALTGERIATDERDLAAWTVVGNVLLNLDETLNLE